MSNKAGGMHVSVFIVALLTIDMQCVANCDDGDDPATRVIYEQPVLQTVFMFCGEILCVLPTVYSFLMGRFARQNNDDSSNTSREGAVRLVEDDTGGAAGIAKPAMSYRRFLWFWMPASCDLVATTCMNMGLMSLPISIFEMTRGSMILFTGLFGVIFLGRRLFVFQWSALFLVALGAFFIGFSTQLKKYLASSAGFTETNYAALIVGIMFILTGQVFTALQFTIEEWLMATYSDIDSSLVVAGEGVFGLLSVLTLVPTLRATHLVSSPYFDLAAGWAQTTSNPHIWRAAIGLTITIAFFNYSGVSITRRLSATSRALVDACRALILWTVSLVLGWEALSWVASPLQILGFSLLVYGTLLYGGLVPVPFRRGVVLEGPESA
ncbi:unnamed protein product [Mycena citricolor]|uniref:Integral membrane protein n=1 Tax=Mycena citricolor TaxID=2018698 RepID=A0AAD2HPW0_9AGAR|nr:unnamed protein product [Mycena citricolor]